MTEDSTALLRRLRLLSDAGAVLDSRRLESMLDELPRLVVRRLADLCSIIHLDSAGAVERVHLAVRDAERERALIAVRNRFGSFTDTLPGEYRAELAQGRSVHVTALDEQFWRRFQMSAEAVDAHQQLGYTSGIFVPLTSGPRLSSAMLLLGADVARTYDADDLAAVEELARRTALTIENGKLLREARELFDADLTGNFVAAFDGRILECNLAFARMLRFATVAEAVEESGTAIFGGDVNWRAFVGSIVRERRVRQQEIALRDREGNQVHVLVSANGLFTDNGQIDTIRGQLYDLTPHQQLEEQLSQSQKMEAVGRLAGGIAHDFNNLLMVVGGQAGRLLDRLPSDSALRPGAEAIAAAADRAAGLTQQLLAFSRRQVHSPQVLSPNAVVRNLHGMLERVIGEDITCTLSLGPDIGNVKVDPGRLEQVLMNLAVNARDAMPNGGTLTISTSIADLDDVYGRQHFNARPGRYVMIAVSDTGCGMGPETRTRIFEPFFTTKDLGKGTGLGLSMVYGIIKQSGGYIWVYSEAGLGTTFKIYLPLIEAPVDELPANPAPSMPTGTETILLVEDEDGVRELLEEILAGQGYRVMAASRGSEALQMAELADDEIQLLVTDVVMPQMSGRELAMRMRAQRPSLRVLYLSGYTEEAIAHHGVIEPDAAFLQKPFTREDLARKIRDVLGLSDPA
jgi:signal transduction histidine kinase